MPNLFLGFPVSRAKIADMISGAAPPLAHVANHRPPGSDPLVLPADITAGQVVGWDGTKFVGVAGGAGIASAYESPGVYYNPSFDSGDGIPNNMSAGSTVDYGTGYLALDVPGVANEYARIYKEFTNYPSTLSWSKAAKFSAHVLMAALTTDKGDFFITIGGRDTERHVGFCIIDGILYGSVGNGAAQTKTAALSDMSGFSFNFASLLAIDFTSVRCKFYLDNVEVAELTTGLPTGTIYAKILFNLYASNRDQANNLNVNLYQYKAWRAIA